VSSTLILSEFSVRQVRWRALRWPIATLVATVLVAAISKNAGWFNVGGGAIAAQGTFMWAGRLLRLMQHADDPLPPAVHEQSRNSVTGLVAVNSDHFNEAQRRQIDNIRAHVGVWLTVIGGIIASVVPFLCGLIHVWTPAT
jgi:hypothetical protein